MANETHLLLLLALAACSGGSSGAGMGLGVPGTACASPVDITAGGSFSGDTCQGAASVPVQGCGGGVRAQIFAVAAENESWSRVFSVTGDFTLAGSMPSACSFSTPGCDAGGIGGGSAPQGTPLYFAAFLADGGCGPFTLQVDNASSCSDSADGGSCTCGDIPACPVGQTCHLAEPQLTGSCVQN